MIMGVPEKHSILGEFSLMKIPLTEESKILPATGIYAVSVLSDKMNSKGMVVISESPDNKPDLLLHIFEDENMFPGKKSTLLFHKMIHGSISLADSKTEGKLQNAKEEISDLIY
jgi:FAD synthase